MEETGEKLTKTVTITINKDNFEVDVVGELLILDLLDILKTLMEDLLDELEEKSAGTSNSKMH